MMNEIERLGPPQAISGHGRFHRWPILVVLLSVFLGPYAASAYSVVDGRIVDAQGQAVQLRGVNWSGFETTDHVVHGLWARNWKSMIDQMRDLGFNAVRLPLCPGTLRGSLPGSIDYALNPDLAGLDSLGLLDAVVHYLDARGLYVLFDHHRPDCGSISELWYTAQYPEAQWIADLTLLAARYGGVARVIGVDPKNEPHGAATWGTGDPATDWNRAAERAAAAVGGVAPHWLIFVEGIQRNPSCSANDGEFWGENLEPLACTPLTIPADRLVLAPHTYGPDVFAQPYFDDPAFPANMAAIWDRRFGRFVGAGHALVIGEFGGKYGEGDPRDVSWQDALVDYLVGKGIGSAFYWTWNANSGDTGGILRDDWNTVREDKLALLGRLWNGSSSPSPPTVALTVDPPGIALGQAATLSWSATNATACTATGAWDGARSTSGSLSVTPPSAGAWTYSLTCTGPGGTTGRAATLTVSAAPTVTVLPAQVQTSSDWGAGYCVNATVTNTTPARVVWATDIAVQGTITDLWSATASAAGGTVRFTGVPWNRELAPAASAQFGFCARGTAGGQTPTVTIAVNPASITVGQSATLTWSSANATACTASGAWSGARPAAGAQTVTGATAGTFTFGLACSGSGGTATGEATLTVMSGLSDGLLPAQVRIQSDWGAGYCADVSVTNGTAGTIAWATEVTVQGTISQLWNARATGTRGAVRFTGVDWNRVLAPGASTQFGFCASR
jgi:endoglucanase